MDTYKFQEGVKVQSFCLTLVGEARLWHESLRPINVDWQGLQNQFRQQYSKIGNTREHLFHVWQSFHFDKNTETLDSCVTHTRQVTTLLVYGEPQILEVFKNYASYKIILGVIPHRRLGQVVEMAKRILSKEKIDRQLGGHSSFTSFMSIKDNYNNKKVTFNMEDGLEDEIDRLTLN